jgi:hypothetical protein
MKPNDKNEGETPFAPTSPQPKKQDLPDSNLPVKRIKLTPDGINQADVDAIHTYMAKMRKRAKVDVLFLGARFAKIRNTVRYGIFTAVVEREFNLNIRTVNNWIRAWEGKDTEFALNDWDGYMRAIYGNEPKKLKGGAPDWRAQERDPDDDDDEQSGGKGPAFGKEEDTGFFADKGKVSLFGFKNIVTTLENEFFQNQEITREAKLEFITELIKWLENQRKNI